MICYLCGDSLGYEGDTHECEHAPRLPRKRRGCTAFRCFEPQRQFKACRVDYVQLSDAFRAFSPDREPPMRVQISHRPGCYMMRQKPLLPP